MIYYQVEYKDCEGTWMQAGPRYSNYADALDRLAFEFKEDPEYSHRIVQSRRVTTVLSEITAKSEVIA